MPKNYSGLNGNLTSRLKLCKAGFGRIFNGRRFIDGGGVLVEKEFMKRLMMSIAVLWVAVELGGGAYAQGTIVFNNLGTNSGLVFIYPEHFSGAGGRPLDQDLNFALLAGPNAGALMLQHAWLLSDGTAKGINVGPGLFADPTAAVFVLPGVLPGASAVVQIWSWSGNYNSLAEASTARAGFGFGPSFTMITGSAGAPPASLVGMPQLDVFGVPVPEPRSFGLMVMGGIALGFLRSGRVRLAQVVCSRPTTPKGFLTCRFFCAGLERILNPPTKRRNRAPP